MATTKGSHAPAQAVLALVTKSLGQFENTRYRHLCNLVTMIDGINDRHPIGSPGRLQALDTLVAGLRANLDEEANRANAAAIELSGGEPIEPAAIEANAHPPGS